MGAGRVDGIEIRYRGQEVTLKGETGRFVLPPDIRKAVRISSGDQRLLCLYPHTSLPCLVGYGESREREFERQLDLQYESGKIATVEEYEQRRGRFFGASSFVFDDSGRFVLPDTLIRHASITDSLYFHGSGPEFWIFSPQMTGDLGPGWDFIRMGCEAAMERQKPAKAPK